jgi:two-component system response regulator AtoC
VVDDNAPVAEAIVRLLGPCFDAACVTDGEAARVRLAAREPFDAVLCDVRMPRMGGLALLRWVQREHPSLLERFVFMTVDPDDQDAQEVARTHGRAVLRKPCTRDELVAALRALAPAS